MGRLQIAWACGAISLFSVWPVSAQRMTAGFGPDGSGDDCTRRCAHQAKQKIAECIHEGGNPKECLAEGHAFLELCVADCAQPPSIDCVNGCVTRASQALTECVEAGHPEDVCRTRAERMLHECIDVHCPLPPECELRCALHARAQGAFCVALGGESEACAAGAEEFLDRCVGEHCAPQTCEQHCHEEARRVFKECVASGVAEEECEARALHFFEQCIAEKCSPADCARLCEEKAGVVRRLCLDVGGSEEECNAWARQFYEFCVSHSCPEHCGGIAGGGCPDGQFCQFRPGSCEIADDQGVCVPIPEACPDVWEPVCGCDGQTYDNACEAAIHRQSVAHLGLCDSAGCGPTGVTCPDGAFCATFPGMCGLEEAAGTCMPRPEACPTMVMPVCGCDGHTYSNACIAASSGVSVDYPGECHD